MAGVCLVLAVLTFPPLDAAPRGHSFGRSSLAGSESATMQLETVPARVSRVVVRPGSEGQEAWAVGTSTARLPGYAQINTGQVVFLKYTPERGWVLRGPPLGTNGRPINPTLGAFDLTPQGDGWAVGDSGTLLHKKRGSDEWREASQSGAVTTQTLTSISLTHDGTGFAVGEGPTIIKLSNGSWSIDSPSPDMTAQTTELQSVSATSGEDAWAVATGQVTGIDSTNLLIYRRSAAGWVTIKTGQAIFDNPPARSDDGVLNRSAEAGVVAADARGAWIGGRLFPRSSANPEGDAAPGDTSRGFIVHFDNATQSFTSYCPDIYTENTGAADLTRMCDEPLPTAPFHIASISIVPGGDVFAGGLGLFRFSGDGWYREPDANGYLISISMGSNSQGFVATPGRSLGAGGLIRSSASTIGHWTSTPRQSSIARWAQPQDQLLQDVAIAADGSRAIAVGSNGSAILFSGAAWDSINPIVGYPLHGVAWPVGDTPWAVAGSGWILHMKGNNWETVKSPTEISLFSVAFRSPSEGVAVGLGGTIITYSGGVWRDDSPSHVTSDLYSVIATSSGYLAVGRNGAVVEGRPGAWKLRTEARALVKRSYSPEAPTFYAATRLGDRVVIGGQDAALIVREASGQLRTFDTPLEGTVLSLSGTDGVLHASVSPNQQKFRGEAPAAQRGTVLRLSEGRWSDIGLKRHSTLLKDKVDPAQFEDPIYSLAMSSADRGWGAGGSPADLKDSADGQYRSLPTGAIYRVSFGADPKQPASVAPLDDPKPGVTFATFGESWCGTGLCSSAVGTGTMADDVALQIRDEINRASRQPGGPKFVAFTGNMRRVGIPEELEQFRNYLDGFDIPVFAAPGNLDRFTGFDVDNASGQSSGSTSGSNDYWKSVFFSQAQPWGNGRVLPNFRAVPGTVAATSGLARNHYAFDYVQSGRAVMRVVFVDSSTKSYGTLQEQNPQEDQSAWLKTVLTEASEVLRIPSVVVMNQPTVLPSDEQIPNWTAAQADFETTVAAARVSAVITGGPRINAHDTIKGLVPMFVVGGGGAELGRDPGVQGLEPASKIPSDGYYHAWHLMRLDPNDPSPLGQALGQVKVFDSAFPVVESLSMHSLDGYRIPAGKTTNITALARGLAGGFSDPDQAKATYLIHGLTMLPCGYKSQGNGYCISGAATLPKFRFYSEDPTKADFVQRSPNNSSEPRKVGKEIFLDPDGSEGLLCVFKLGRVGINAVAGLHRARIEIEGIPGNGACVEAAVKGVRIIQPPKPEPPKKPVPPEPERFFRAPRPRQEIAIVFPPPPAPVVAPAPPGAPGVGKKEEHEFEVETEGHSTDHAFTALSHSRAVRTAGVESAWPILGGTLLLSFFGAVAAASLRERRSLAPQRAIARKR